MGFQWIKGDDSANNMLSYVRWGTDNTPILAVVNLSGSTATNYRLGLPRAGEWELLLNTDADIYAGAGTDLPTTVRTDPTSWDGQGQSFELTVPAASVQYYIHRG